MTTKSKIKPLQWSDVLFSNNEVRYTHCIAETPLGNIVISWKSWKENPSYDINDFFGSYLSSYFSLEEAKKASEQEYVSKIEACLVTDNLDGETT